jgi:hypothetical protein
MHALRWTMILGLAAGCTNPIGMVGDDDVGGNGSGGTGGDGPGSGGTGGSDTGGSGGSGQDDPARLFSTSSPWNVPATGGVDPGSVAMTSSGMPGSLADSFLQAGRNLDIAGTDDYPDYGIPVFEGQATTPRVAVRDTNGWWGGGFAAVPIPADAVPARGTDHHLSILDRGAHTLWEFWEMQKAADGQWTAGAGAQFDTTGPGYRNQPNQIGARAYGGAAAAGLIRRDEIVRGEIRHALAMAYNWTRGKTYAQGLGVDGVTQNIASHNDNVTDANRNTVANIPEGARLRLKAAVDVAARCGANAACRTIGTALKTYGAFMVDTAGVTTLVAEVLTGRPQNWAGVLRSTDVSVFGGNDFEVLAMPAVLTQAP